MSRHALLCGYNYEACSIRAKVTPQFSTKYALIYDSPKETFTKAVIDVA